MEESQMENINKKEQQCMHTLNSPPHIVHATRYDNVKYSSCC